ncbi:GlcNAc transferase, partial [Escherichia coli]|nr:GlcNAc transferase [Escherichia coli]
MWPHVALFIPFYVRISGESVKPGMITAPVIHVPGNIRAYRVLVTANKAL